jgi:hypothetical protein
MAGNVGRSGCDRDYKRTLGPANQLHSVPLGSHSGLKVDPKRQAILRMGLSLQLPQAGQAHAEQP